jgi:hypothetical protein
MKERKHCCQRMELELAKNSETPDRFQCPDALIHYALKFDEYGIIIHDGGASSVQIYFCPWCGTQLPPSKRDRWFDELERQGIDPLSDSVPEPFQSDAWYKSDGGETQS